MDTNLLHELNKTIKPREDFFAKRRLAQLPVKISIEVDFHSGKESTYTQTVWVKSYDDLVKALNNHDSRIEKDIARYFEGINADNQSNGGGQKT